MRYIPPTIARNRILELVCIEFGVTITLLKSKSRLRSITDARKAYCYIMRRHTSEVLSAIGREVNNKHSTVAHNIKSASDLIEVGDFIKSKIERIEKQLN